MHRCSAHTDLLILIVTKAKIEGWAPLDRFEPSSFSFSIYY